MKTYYVKSATDTCEPWPVQADSKRLAAQQLAHNCPNNAVVQVWTPKERENRESPTEFDVYDLRPGE